MATMEDEVMGEHWGALRALLPVYQAISTCEIGDSRTTDFWNDAWSGPDDLATTLPALYSHCVKRRVSVREVKNGGLFLVPRLTNQAAEELVTAWGLIDGVVISTDPDKR